MTFYERNQQNQIRRHPERASYDHGIIYDIVDEALICHVGFVQDGQPFVIPTIHARDDNVLIFHGAKASRLLKHIASGLDICVTVTILDGLVLARSVFHHSMNYRSAVLFGRGRIVEEKNLQLRHLRILSEHIMPGRWDDARVPNDKELRATSVVAMTIDRASAKIRSGPPVDDEEDHSLPIWAGVLPIQQQFLEPLADPLLSPHLEIPDYMRRTITTREVGVKNASLKPNN